MPTDTRSGRRGNRPLEARMPADERDLLIRLAEAQGTTASEIVRAYIRYHIGVPGAELPPRPEVTRHDLQPRAVTDGDGR